LVVVRLTVTHYKLIAIYHRRLKSNATGCDVIGISELTNLRKKRDEIEWVVGFRVDRKTVVGVVRLQSHIADQSQSATAR
jgi:hypothetical protein